MQQQTVYAFFLDTVKYEFNFWSYWIYLALLRGYLKHDDPASMIICVPFSEQDIAKIREMEKKDVLGLNRIKLFATRLKDTTYAFYFAEDVKHAANLHESLYHTRPKRWHNVYKQMQYTYIPYVDINKAFWQIKEDLMELPYFVGEFDVKELVGVRKNAQNP